ncbi:MAG: DnaJ domain-containing protein [Blastocatellia bacterium]|nr:DnaJ domain-containing protein [Blastocatellia bacterium]
MSYRLEQTSFPKLLCGCHKQRLSGTLTIKFNGVTKSVYLEDGAIIYASSDIISERFGERLRTSGRISPEQFEKAMVRMKTDNQQLGTCLTELGFLSEAELQALLLEQVCHIIYSLFPWQEGQYEFSNERVNIQGFHLPFPTADIIFRGIRQMSDMTLVRRWLGDFKRRLVPNPDPFMLFQTVNLQPQEGYIVSRLDGPLSLNDLLAVCGVPEEQVLRTACALQLAGIVEFVDGETLPPLVNQSVAESLHVHDATLQIDAAVAAQLCFDLADVLHNIETGADHYQVLGISRRATSEEIKRAFREMAKKYHPDRHSQLAAFDFQVKSELERAFIRFQQAYEVLGDEAKRRKYDGQLRFPTTSTGQPTPPSSSNGQALGSRSTPVSSPTYSTPRPFPNPTQPTPPVAQPPSRSFAPPTTPQSPQSPPSRSFAPPNTPQSPPPSRPFAPPTTPPPTVPRPTASSTPSPYNTPPRPFAPAPPAQPAPPAAAPPSPYVTPRSTQYPPPSASGTANPWNNQPTTPYPRPAAPSKPVDSLGTNLSASEYYMRCIEFLGQNDLERAFQAIRRAVEMKPKNCDYHAQMARVLTKMQGHNKQAEKEYLIAIELDPENPELVDLFLELADLYCKFGMTGKAVEILQRALEKDPNHLEAQRRFEKIAPPQQVSGWKKATGRFTSLMGKVLNKENKDQCG